MIKFLIKGQEIETLEHEIIAADQVSFVNIKFAFDNNWKPLHKVVKFVQECEEYFRVLGVDGTSCYLPAELHPGAVKMSLFGYDASNSETVRATTIVKTLNIRPSGFEGEGTTEIPPTPDLYQQLLQQIQTGASGKSAYEIAVESGFSGSVEDWLQSLKGADGKDGKDGENGIDGQPGIDGKSAFEIAVEHGFSGTEQEWINSNNLDLSVFVTSEDVQKIVENATPDLSPYITRVESEKIAESKFQTVKNDLNTLENNVNSDIQEVRESVSTVVEQAHWHHNLTLLNGITSAKIAKWDSGADWKLQFQSLQDNVMDYQLQMNHRMDDTDTEIGEIQADIQQFKDSNQYDHQIMNDTILMLENRITLLESLHENGGITLFSADDINTENLFTVYNCAYNSLADFSKNYPHFLSRENGIYFNIDDFGWDGAVFLICDKELNLSEKSQILMSYQSGAMEEGELYLIAKPEKNDVPISVYAYTQIQNGTANKIAFKWLYSEDFITTLTACNVPTGTYYFALKGRSNNTKPKIKSIKIQGG